MDKIGKYEVIEELGRGGMGNVYKAFDPQIERTVAIKVVSERVIDQDEVRERFIREARSAGKLAHENITVVHDIGELDGKPYIVMEYLSGVDLKAIIEAQADLDLTRKLDYAIQICRGLEFAHRNKIIHRDIKPENIKVLQNGRIKIMDFGIAKPESSNLTEHGALLGTPSYMSPEQIRGEDVDQRSDIFSFGVLFHELLSYRKPFGGRSTTTIIYNIVHEEPDLLEISGFEFLDDLQSILAMCLQKEPSKRYASFTEVMLQLDALRRRCEREPEITSHYVVDSRGVQASPVESATIHNLVKQGQSSFEEGKYEEAEKIFRLILMTFPAHAIAIQYLERIRKALSDSQDGKTDTKSGNQTTVLTRSVPGPVGRSWKGPGLVAAVLVVIVGGWFLLKPKTVPEVEVQDPPPLEQLAVSEDPAPESIRVTEARKAMLTAKSNVDQGQGQPEFASALAAENAGHLAVQEGRSEQAILEYKRARDLYESAAMAVMETEVTFDQGNTALRATIQSAAQACDRQRRLAESSGAKITAGTLYQSALNQQLQAKKLAASEEQPSMTAALEAYRQALSKFAEAKDKADMAKNNQTRAQASRADMQKAKAGATSVMGSLETGDGYAEAESAVKRGEHLYQQGEYQSASDAFVQAADRYNAMRAAWTIKRKKEIATLKDSMLTRKAAADADLDAATYAEAEGLIRRADNAAASEKWDRAETDYRRAAELFSGLEKKVAVEVDPMDGQLSEFVARYKRLLESGDADALASLLNFSKTEKRSWEAFFDGASDIKAELTRRQITRNGSNARVDLGVLLKYFNKSKRTREQREYPLNWQLVYQSNRWVVLQNQ